MARYSARRIFIIAGIILALLVLLTYLGLFRKIQTALRNGSIPLLSSAHSFSIKLGDDYRFFNNRDEFFTAYQACMTSGQNAAVEQAQITELTNENDELRQELNFQKTSKTTLAPANVIGTGLVDSEQTILIDRGTTDGIAIGQPVIVGNGILVGKVLQTDTDTSIVRLINDNDSRIGATVLSSDKSIGVIEGGYGISLKMDFIPRNETIIVGQQVITSGEDTNVPRGLLIGTVTSVQNEAYQPFQEAILTPEADLSKLSLVAVIIK